MSTWTSRIRPIAALLAFIVAYFATVAQVRHVESHGVALACIAQLAVDSSDTHSQECLTDVACPVCEQDRTLVQGANVAPPLSLPEPRPLILPQLFASVAAPIQVVRLREASRAPPAL